MYNSRKILVLVLCLFVLAFWGCKEEEDESFYEPRERTEPDENSPIVYMTNDISSEGLIAVYEALGKEASGNVAVKISTGEPGPANSNKYYLAPSLIKDLVQMVDGTIVECNTAYGGQRDNTEKHYQIVIDHGFTAIAPVVILDDVEEMSIPVTGGKNLTENIIGKKFDDFDFHIVLSHFKGHIEGGFGGALKNMSIGYASSAGKAWIHTGGRSRTSIRGGTQYSFLESMAEAAKSISDKVNGNILYINVMNNLSIDCDCFSDPVRPTMADIGILASLDPVALDQACVDLVYEAHDGKDLIRRMETKSGLLTLDHAEDIGLGSRAFHLVNLDNK